MTTATTDQPARPRWSRQPNPLGEHIADVVGRLQSRLLRERPDPEAIGALARLRRGIGREPGSDYSLERYLLVPDRLLGYVPQDGAADAEYAAHDAITLYALHQQSQSKKMHVPGNGLGAAVSTLLGRSDGPEGVRRRFGALGTAASYAEAIYHLRSLITMLRGHEVPLDYGLLADDLDLMRKPYGGPRVRAAWGREFFRSRPDDQPATDAPSTDATEETES